MSKFPLLDVIVHNTVRSLYFVTAVFALFLCEILIKFETQWQFWNLLVMRIPKHPQHAQFDEVLAEIFQVKDNLYFSKINFVSSFSLPIFSVISSLILKIRDRFVICSSWGFQNWHWLLKLMKNWQRYSRLKARPNFRKDDENMNLTSAVAK